ncbi:YaaC family protein [Caldalkalibacillus salinus]|uniref:YaaC family protein n=1 Tax=Caldalkalibacillus salinus TaxID=2803787 RepID=UPI001924BEAB|nr:YaaC family protein [Caldalkalibacillus salinus]
MEQKWIATEDVFEKMWGMFLYFQNEATAKELLYYSYVHLDEGDLKIQDKDEASIEDEASKMATLNTNKFIYFLKQGVAYLQSARNSEFIVRPLLQYYGMTSLMKALILKHDPYYPRKTSVLQHGITTRKKKKSHYRFTEDEIKVQKHGLLPLFSQVVTRDPLPLHSKHTVIDLIATIPELRDSYYLLYKELTLLPISLKQINSSTWEVAFDQSDAGEVPPFNQLLSLFSLGFQEGDSILSTDEKNASFTFFCHQVGEQHSHKQIFFDMKGNAYFFLRHPLTVTDEIAIFNMLSYLLGMLCRYDTELWGELIFSFGSDEVYLIHELLQVCLRKFPNLVLNLLYNQRICFYHN